MWCGICERTIEVIVRMQNKAWCSGRGMGVRVDVNQELKLLQK